MTSFDENPVPKQTSLEGCGRSKVLQAVTRVGHTVRNTRSTWPIEGDDGGLFLTPSYPPPKKKKTCHFQTQLGDLTNFGSAGADAWKGVVSHMNGPIFSAPSCANSSACCSRFSRKHTEFWAQATRVWVAIEKKLMFVAAQPGQQRIASHLRVTAPVVHNQKQATFLQHTNPLIQTLERRHHQVQTAFGCFQQSQPSASGQAHPDPSTALPP